MGCDIHIFVEKKEGRNWNLIDHAWGKWGVPGDEEKYFNAVWEGRNYDLFAILADVSNGHGFAGCDTGDGFNPISEPRGLPDDVSDEVQEESDKWGEDGHSHSYFTLAELLEYDWEQTTYSRGVVSEKEYRAWDKKGRPESYCGGVSGPNVVILPSCYAMDNLISGKKKRVKGEEYYCRVQWKVTYKDAVGDFYENAIPALKALGKPDKVRIVFWFDN